MFREFGPLAGNTMRLSYEVSPNLGDTLGRQTGDIDARYYLRLGGSGLLALRAKAFKSWGDAPDFIYFGGNSEMRGTTTCSSSAQRPDSSTPSSASFIEAMLTPVGVLGGIRGVLFANMGGARFEGQPYKWFSNNAELYTPVVNYNISPFGSATPVFGTPQRVDGFRLVDARASTASGSRHSPWASPSTSTGHGERSSTSRGRTCSSLRAVAAPRSAKRNLRCGSATTSETGHRDAETQSLIQ